MVTVKFLPLSVNYIQCAEFILLRELICNMHPLSKNAICYFYDRLDPQLPIVRNRTKKFKMKVDPLKL